jgi:hypothetical protein
MTNREIMGKKHAGGYTGPKTKGQSGPAATHIQNLLLVLPLNHKIVPDFTKEVKGIALRRNTAQETSALIRINA